MQDTVCIDIKSDFDLRHARAAREGCLSGRNVRFLCCHWPFYVLLAERGSSLQAGYRGCGEDLFLLRRDGGVAFDKRCHDAAQGFDPKSERDDVEQQDVFDFACEDAALDGCADGDDFIRVNPFMSFFAEDRFDHLLNSGHTGHTADEDHFADIYLC